jgi:hypothetical protein
MEDNILSTLDLMSFDELLCLESLTRRSGRDGQQDYAARQEKKKIFDALALASILNNSALESANKVTITRISLQK